MNGDKTRNQIKLKPAMTYTAFGNVSIETGNSEFA